MSSLIEWIYSIFYWLAAGIGSTMGLMSDDSIRIGNKVIKVKKGTLIIVFLSCVLIAFSSSMYKDHLANVAKYEQDSLNFKRMRMLVDDNARIVASAMRDSRDFTVHAVDSTATNVAKSVASGIELNKEEHEKTRKEAAKGKLKPPHIEFIAEPHNLFRLEFSDDSLTGYYSITNTGDNVAYGLTTYANIIMEIDGEYFKLLFPAYNAKKDLSSNLHRMGGFGIAFDADVYKKVKNTYCVINGRYYLDDKLTIGKDFCIGTVRAGTGEPRSYDLPIPPCDLVKKAKRFRNYYETH